MRAPVITEKMKGHGLAEYETRPINVKDPPFMAKGDGVTNDTLAFQNALASAAIISHAVYVPDGIFLISATLIIQAGVSLIGEGCQSWTTDTGTVLDFSAATLTDAITLGATDVTQYGIRLKDLKVKVGAGITNGVAMNITQSVVKSSIENVVVYGGSAVGFDIQNCWNIIIDQAISQGNDIGFKITNGGIATTSTVKACIAYNCKTYGWFINSAITSTTFISCYAETVKDAIGDTGTGWYLAGTMRQCTFIECGTERCWKYHWHINTDATIHANLISPLIPTSTSNVTYHDTDCDVIYIENCENRSLLTITGLRTDAAQIPAGTGLIFKNDKLQRNALFVGCRILGTAGITETNCVLLDSMIGFVSYHFHSLNATLVWDPGNILDGAGVNSGDIPVTGALTGDFALVSASASLQSIICTAFVRINGQARIRLQNETGGAINLGELTWRVRVFVK